MNYVYLDTHFIDYLWDHRAYIWDEDERSIRRAARVDASSQIEEYEALAELPNLLWLNGWCVVIGDCVLDELSRIKKRHRRSHLMTYAKRLKALKGLAEAYDDCDEEPEEECDESAEEEVANAPIHPAQLVLPSMSAWVRETLLGIPFDLPIEFIVGAIPRSDQPLVREALAMECGSYLTTDARVLDEAAFIERCTGLRIRKLTDFLDDVDDAPGWGSKDGSWPDLQLYTDMIA